MSTNLSAKKLLFLDSASTTRCSDAAARLVHRYAVEDFGNPSSSHCYGKTGHKAIQEARAYFASIFGVDPAQIIFTGSGSESDNLALYGVALESLARQSSAGAARSAARPRILVSATEHAAVRKTAQSLIALGFDCHEIPVDHEGQIRRDELLKLLTPETLLVSIHQVNNVIGAVHPVEELARLVKSRVPTAIFHTDSVQAFGKVPHPRAGSGVDLVSVSAHKIKGPKGVGALLVLEPSLLGERLRPMIWGGEQEGGYRSGTQNAGLIAGFHIAADETLACREATVTAMHTLNRRLRDRVKSLGAAVHWNSPETGVPHIVSLSIVGRPGALVAGLLEERGFLVSTGSACSSKNAAPDSVLSALGVPAEIRDSAIRISFDETTRAEDIDHFANTLGEVIAAMDQMLGKRA